MVRVSNGLQRHKRHRKFIKAAKGFRLGRGNVYKQVRSALVKQGQHAYRNRKEKKREFRKLWIERLSAILRSKGSNYSSFMKNAAQKDMQINRKILSNVALAFPQVFDEIYNHVQK